MTFEARDSGSEGAYAVDGSRSRGDGSSKAENDVEPYLGSQAYWLRLGVLQAEISGHFLPTSVPAAGSAPGGAGTVAFEGEDSLARRAVRQVVAIFSA